MDPEPLSRSTTPIASPNHQNTAQLLIQEEISTTSEEPNGRSSDAMSSTVSDCTLEITFHSPPIQVMERDEAFDFEHRRLSSSSSTEWSSVSNDSLFSIHMTNSYTHNQAHLLAVDVFKADGFVTSGDLTRPSSPMGVESDVDSLSFETPSNLDEPQKVVRWKTQVERPADEGMPPQGHQWEPSPLNDHKSSEFGNQATAKPKKKFLWSSCNCGSCNLPKWSCWNGCFSNCKPKKVCSPHAGEASTPTSGAPKKLDV